MLSILSAAGLSGLNGFAVTVECSIQHKRDKDSFDIVGLPDAAVREARERIRTTIEACGYRFPEGNVTINLAPADQKKNGSGYDLSLLLSILYASGQIRGAKPNACYIGELSLSGEVRGVHGVLSMVLAARDAGKTELYVPAENAAEASVVEDVVVYGVSDVSALLSHLSGKHTLTAATFDRARFAEQREAYRLDFADVRGQARAKRALEIAAAGGHNLLMIGPPGTGKSMLAKRLPSILPELSFGEAVEVTRIHSAAGLLAAGESLCTERPFRAPHHTLSAAALAGGGAIPTPGEVSLSHNGVLFLDELPEFNRSVTEVLRQPMEDGKITVTRAAGRFTFPSRFTLVCAMNPCKCGYFGHPTHPCTCSEAAVKKYLSKISGPLIDRIDIQIELPSMTYDELHTDTAEESSATVRARVNAARAFAAARLAPEDKDTYCNAALTATQVRKYCKLSPDAEAMLAAAFETLGLSARGHDRILRVARTIADLAASETIEAAHIGEAIQMRSLDRAYW